MREITKKYSNGEINIIWKPHKCMHAGVCARTLPEVYRPKEKPWIIAEGADTSALKDQIGRCPSGALSWEAVEKS
jgi:uncharacterized Fe-S cluster protein YjdI